MNYGITLKTIKLDMGGRISLSLSEPNENGGWDSVSIRSNLNEICGYCGNPDCSRNCEGYEEYKSSVSVLFPFPQKKN